MFTTRPQRERPELLRPLRSRPSTSTSSVRPSSARFSSPLDLLLERLEPREAGGGLRAA